MVRLHELERPQAGPALGRAAPARGAGAGDRQPPAGAPARRAARRAGPQAAPADAGGAQAHPARGRDHVRLRDPRPGGGADDERPHRRLQRRRHRADRHAGRGLRASRPTSSWPASWASRTSSSATAAGSPFGRRRSISSSTTTQRPARCTSSPDASRDVSYVGMVTRFVVELDGAASCRSSGRTSTPRQEALEQQGRHVRVGWPDEHAYAIPPRESQPEEGQNEESGPSHSRSAAALTLAAALAARRLRGRRQRRRLGRGRPEARSARARGKVNLIAWAGYVEDGSTDPKVDWVSDFEKQTGCKVNTKIGNTSDEMVTLMRTGKYDGVSASGDATLRLIAGGDVDAGQLDLCRTTRTSSRRSRTSRTTPSTACTTAIPHGRGANLLMWHKDKVKPAPDSWGVVFDGEARPTRARSRPTTTRSTSPTRRCTSRPRSPTSEIDNVYELDDKQFHAAVDLLKNQRKNIGEYWSDYTKAAGGLHVAATRWSAPRGRSSRTYCRRTRSRRRSRRCCPKEGGTGWSDTWMISSKAKHPNCMYRWMN